MFFLPWWMFALYLLACRVRVHPLRSWSLFCHQELKLLFFTMSDADMVTLVLYFTTWEITLTIDKGRTQCGYVLVFVRKSMTVNGRNPSTKPHLSSWITDIINRRDSSISPVFPIQRWGAGLFPSLSADLMTFTKLLYVCTHTVMCLWMCVFLCMPITFYANTMLSVSIPVIIYINLAWVDGLLFLSGLMFYFCFAVMYVDNHADL